MSGDALASAEFMCYALKLLCGTDQARYRGEEGGGGRLVCLGAVKIG